MAGINSSAALPPHTFDGSALTWTPLQRRRQARVRVFRGCLCRTYLHFALSHRAAPCRGNGIGSVGVGVGVGIGGSSASLGGSRGVHDLTLLLLSKYRLLRVSELHWFRGAGSLGSELIECSVEALNLKEDLLRGIYAYSEYGPTLSYVLSSVYPFARTR
jgi:hypothetical protein